jgi:peptidoglycan/xylan/chitin deacetylase (PgdA/CDA1 family)
LPVRLRRALRRRARAAAKGPLRQITGAARLLKGTSSGTLILAYHRVAVVERDPHGLCVVPDRFAEQVEYLQRHVDVVPLHAVRDGGSGMRVAVTFDDGYVDNASVAKPVLESLGVPATFFITAGMIDTGREFWWDRLESLLLGTPATKILLDVEIEGQRRHLDLSNEAARRREHDSLHRELRVLPADRIERALRNLASAVESPPSDRETHRPLSVQELKGLSSGLLAIGAHTVTHPLLAARSVTDQGTEIVRGRQMLEQAIGQTVSTFSYPFGGNDAFSDQTVRLVEDAGYVLACTGLPGSVSRKTHPLRLPRHFVRDWGVAQFSEQISHWFRRS